MLLAVARVIHGILRQSPDEMTRRVALLVLVVVALTGVLMFVIGRSSSDRASQSTNRSIAGSAVTNGTPVSSQDHLAPLKLVCHELIGGEPSDDPTIYQLDGRTLYSISLGEKRVISLEGEMLNLSTTTGDEGTEESFATHSRNGNIVTRTIFWQRPGEAKRVGGVDRFDFGRQTVVDTSSGEDTCHHRA